MVCPPVGVIITVFRRRMWLKIRPGVFEQGTHGDKPRQKPASGRFWASVNLYRVCDHKNTLKIQCCAGNWASVLDLTIGPRGKKHLNSASDKERVRTNLAAIRYVVGSGQVQTRLRVPARQNFSLSGKGVTGTPWTPEWSNKLAKMVGDDPKQVHKVSKSRVRYSESSREVMSLQRPKQLIAVTGLGTKFQLPELGNGQ